EQVRRVGHRFHAAGDDHFRRAGLDQVVAQHHRLHARAADLVDRGASGRRRHLGAQRRLPRRRLAQPGRQHATHDHLVDLVGGEAGMGERAGDGGAAQLRGRHAGELAEEGTDGGALGTDDDDIRSGHWESPLRVRPWGRMPRLWPKRPRMLQCRKVAVALPPAYIVRATDKETAWARKASGWRDRRCHWPWHWPWRPAAEEAMSVPIRRIRPRRGAEEAEAGATRRSRGCTTT